MNFLEKDLEDIIFSNLQTKDGVKTLMQRGFPAFDGLHFRQPYLGDYGRADIISIKINKDKSIDVYIYELKQDAITFDSVTQLCRYIKAVNEIASPYFLNVNITGFVIGRRTQMTDECLFVTESLKGVGLFLYDYYIDGLKFFNEFLAPSKDFITPDLNFSFSQIKRAYGEYQCFGEIPF